MQWKYIGLCEEGLPHWETFNEDYDIAIWYAVYSSKQLFLTIQGWTGSTDIIIPVPNLREAKLRAEDVLEELINA